MKSNDLTHVLNSCDMQPDGLVAQVDPLWLQGRSVYGGLQAALAVTAMQELAEGLPIRTLQATLCAPIPVGAVNLRATLLRGSKNTRQIEARIVDGDETLAVFMGIFGRPRESAVAHAMQLPELALKDPVKMPFVEGMTPRFLQFFDADLLHGHFPTSGCQDTTHRYRVTLHDSAEQSSLAHVAAIADFPPPIGLSWLKQPTPGSTMTWMLNFTGFPVDGHSLSGWTIDVQLDAAHDGYTQQSVGLFAPDGHAIARGTQCMVIYG